MTSDKKPTKTRLLFSKNIKEYRSRLGYSQEDLASETGLHRTYIGSVERGERNVSIDNIEVIAKALKTSVASLLSEKEDELL